MEEENTKTLVTLSEIDELKVIANNHYLMGKFNDAIKVAERIIDIAENAKLYTVVREHTNFIANIYKKIRDEDKFSLVRDNFEKLKRNYEKLIKNNEIPEAHRLVNEFRVNNEKFISLNEIEVVKDFFEADKIRWDEFSQKESSLKKKLEPLEIQLNSYLSTNNLELARVVIQKAKPFLSELHDREVLKMWDTVEAMFTELRDKEDLEKKIQDTLTQTSELTDKYQFTEAKGKLQSVLEEVQRRNLTQHIPIIEKKINNVKDAEIKYKDLEKELTDLEKQVIENVSKNLFKLAIDSINQIIKISRFIGKTQNLEKYTKYIEEIELKIKRIKLEQKVREDVKVLNVRAIQALKKGDFYTALEKFENIILKIDQLNVL